MEKEERKIADMKRKKTKFPGVYTIDTKRHGKTFYIRYWKKGSLIEEKAGRQNEGITASGASKIRTIRATGIIPTNQELREEERYNQKQSSYTIEEIWAEYQASKGEYKSLKTDQSNYKHLHCIAHKEPEEITKRDIDRIKKSLSNRSKQTIKHILSFLIRLVKYGKKSGLAGSLRCYIEMPKRLNNIKEDALDSGQIKALLEAIKADPNKAVGQIMRLALYTGMRKSEILGLTRADVDFLRGFLTLKNTKSGKDKTIPLNAEARQVLQEIKITSRKAYIFPGQDGKRRQNITIPARRIMRRAGIPDSVRPLHSLRHTFASQLASSGVDMYVLQKLMTHSNSAMTQRYAHLADEALKAGSEKISLLFKT